MSIRAHLLDTATGRLRKIIKHLEGL